MKERSTRTLPSLAVSFNQWEPVDQATATFRILLVDADRERILPGFRKTKGLDFSFISIDFPSARDPNALAVKIREEHRFYPVDI